MLFVTNIPNDFEMAMQLCDSVLELYWIKASDSQLKIYLEKWNVQILNSYCKF